MFGNTDPHSHSRDVAAITDEERLARCTPEIQALVKHLQEAEGLPLWVAYSRAILDPGRALTFRRERQHDTVSLANAAQILGLDEGTVRSIIRQGRLPATGTGDHIRVRRDDADALARDLAQERRGGT